MKVDGTPETFEELMTWLKDSADDLDREANAQHINNDFDLMRVRCIYGQEMAKLCGKAVYRLASILDEQSKKTAGQ